MAPRKRKTKVSRTGKQTNKIDEDNLTLESVLCPICRSVLIEPVTLPCGHNFCLACFNGTVNNAALVCPLCRFRIGSWLRQVTKENKLVNLSLWQCIQRKFESLILSKQKGDDSFEDDIFLSPAPIPIAAPGEIKKEYEKQRAEELTQIEKERQDEESKSRELILKLQEEEQLAANLEAEKLKRDEEMARQLAEEEQKEVKSTPKSAKKRGPMDIYVSLNLNKQKSRKSPTSDQQREPFRKNGRIILESCQNKHLQTNFFPPSLSIRDRRQYLLNDSVNYMKQIFTKEGDDIIDKEITHIKPINLVPRTPPKSDVHGAAIEKPIIHTTPLRLNLENIEYGEVKSPIPNIIGFDQNHKSAFKSASPYKNENLQTRTSKAVKRIDFSCSPSHLKLPTEQQISPYSSPARSPLLGFKNLLNKECKCTHYLDQYLHSCSKNGVINRLLSEKPKLNEEIPTNGDDNCATTSQTMTASQTVALESCSRMSTTPESTSPVLDVIQEQKRLEKLILQEQEDLLFAQKLQEEFDRVENRQYELRRVRTGASNKSLISNSSSKKRQSTINEMCTRKKIKIQ